LCALVALTTVTGRLSAQAGTLALTVPPGSLTVSTATPGSQPTANGDNQARYTVNVTSGRMKISGQLDSPLPAGVTLSVQLAAPAGSTSLGSVALNSSSTQDLVRFISPGQTTGLQVTFVLTASVSAGAVNYSSIGIVLTLAAAP